MSVESHDSLTSVRESRKDSIVINSANDSNFFIWKLILLFTVENLTNRHKSMGNQVLYSILDYLIKLF